MAWTKRELIVDAFGELALAGYVFDLTPEEFQAAQRRLDLMMASWDSRGLKLGYRVSLTPGAGDIDEDSGIPLVAGLAVVMGLAVALAASMGKSLAASTRAGAKAAYDALVSRAARGGIRDQQLRSGTPLGAGAGFRTFVTEPDTGILRGNGSGLVITGG